MSWGWAAIICVLCEMKYPSAARVTFSPLVTSYSRKQWESAGARVIQQIGVCVQFRKHCKTVDKVKMVLGEQFSKCCYLLVYFLPPPCVTDWLIYCAMRWRSSNHWAKVNETHCNAVCLLTRSPHIQYSVSSMVICCDWCLLYCPSVSSQTTMLSVNTRIVLKLLKVKHFAFCVSLSFDTNRTCF